jgi:uncharacterized Zn finger protein (UPF0148 family)
MKRLNSAHSEKWSHNEIYRAGKEGTAFCPLCRVSHQTEQRQEVGDQEKTLMLKKVRTNLSPVASSSEKENDSVR